MYNFFDFFGVSLINSVGWPTGLIINNSVYQKKLWLIYVDHLDFLHCQPLEVVEWDAHSVYSYLLSENWRLAVQYDTI